MAAKKKSSAKKTSSKSAHAKSTHEHHGFDYVEIEVKDLAKSKKFYAGAFGWAFNDYGPEYAGIKGTTRETGGLRQVDPGVAVKTGGGPLVILFSKNLDDTVERVKKAGGKIVTKPFAFPGGRRFHFADPSGNELAVWGSA